MKKEKGSNEISFLSAGKVVFKLLGAFLLNCVVAGALCAIIKTHQHSEVINLLCNFGVAACVGVHVMIFMRGPEYLFKKEIEKSNKEEVEEPSIEEEIEKEHIKEKEKTYTTEEKIEALKHEKELLLQKDEEKEKVKVKEA